MITTILTNSDMIGYFLPNGLRLIYSAIGNILLNIPHVLPPDLEIII